MQKHKWLFLIFSIAIYLLLIGLPYYFFCDASSFIQTWATIVAGLILLWYTWETMLIRQIANAQREISIQPFVVLKNVNGQYLLENLGSGVALNVFVASIVKGDEDYKLEISFPQKIAVLKAQSEVAIKPVTKINNEEASEIYAAAIDPKYANEATEVNISFSNVEGRKFSVAVIISPNNLSIKKFQDNFIG